MPECYVPSPHRRGVNLFDDAAIAQQRAFFGRHPELAPTPLVRLPALARHLGIGQLLVKDETSRFGLNAFKSVGAQFTLATLRDRGDIREGDTLVCASEGNHGRAVARAARIAKCRARVYMAANVAPSRVRAIEHEGAEVVLVPGTYDEAVKAMAREAAARGWTVISDTSWPGYDEIPRLIMLGYTRILDETADAAAPPDADVIFVPGGVGGLLAAVACWCDWRFGAARPRVVSVEPRTAACLLTSARHGRPTTLTGPFETAMGGLRCGEVSPGAFPAVATLVDGFVAIEDDYAFEAMRRLARPAPGDPAIECGASGAAALGGVLATLAAPELAALREALALGVDSRVLVIASEGVTDPELFQQVVARR